MLNLNNVDAIEEWKIIPNFSNYSASNLGRIKNNNRGTIRKQHIAMDGYYNISIINDQYKNITCSAHRLVAMAWLTNPDNKPTVNHKNKNRIDNNINNLEWATYSEQIIHANKNRGEIINACNVGI
jgi:hypothetical protein